VVVDDCRFQNEAEAVLAAGGWLVKIERPDVAPIASGHSSEGNELPASFHVRNGGTMPDFLRCIDAVLDGLVCCSPAKRQRRGHSSPTRANVA
jgi:hypothetical protein